MNFYSAYDQGFARVAACTGPVHLADPAANVREILDAARACHDEGVAAAVFTELGISGYALDDLLLQEPLLESVLTALADLVAASKGLRPLLLVGAPLRRGTRLYNSAVAVQGGRILGVVPKSYLPNYREFYERRHFGAGDEFAQATTIRLLGEDVPFGTKLLFEASDVPGLVVHAEICEDLWVPIPPSAYAALAGATVLANLSSSPITVGRAEDRRELCRHASARGLAAYVYAAAGEGESTTDLAWDGQTLVFENGVELAASERFPDGPRRSVADIDLELLRSERTRMGTFDDNRRAHTQAAAEFVRIPFTLDPPRHDIGLLRPHDRFPFVPDNPQRLAQDCFEAYNIQVAGLEQRLRAIGQPKVVIGVSGGLDSTQALIVAAQAMDRLGRPRSDILAYTLPGFATSDHTKANATALAAALGVSFAEIDIRPAAERMLADLGHPYSSGQAEYDVTFENVQAGLRTDYLFRLANSHGGIVLGTGDLSELALGWCTYGVGDQMSHYNVNGGIPKTLIQHLIRWVVAERLFSEETGRILESILATEISPELVPVAVGERPQSTQDKIGPYALHDFTLFWTLRYGLRSSRIAFLAWHAWRDATTGLWPSGIGEADRRAYSLSEIRRWLEVFEQRFFGFAQFKRSAVPNGPKVVAGGSLSPRGDWRAPSDTSAKIWLDELRKVPNEG